MQRGERGGLRRGVGGESVGLGGLQGLAGAGDAGRRTVTGRARRGRGIAADGWME